MRRSAWPGAAVLVSLSLLTACGGPAAQPQETPSGASASATATPTTTETASVPATPVPTTGAPASASWTTYTTAAGDLAFDLPSTWSIRDPAGEPAEGGGAFAEVTSEAQQARRPSELRTLDAEQWMHRLRKKTR